MAATVFPRATYFYQDGAYGFSETFYGVGVTDLQTLQTNGDALAKKRVQMLGGGVCHIYTRYSMDNVWRDSLVTYGTPTASGNPALCAYNKNLNPSDNPYSCVLIRMNSGTLYRKSLFLSGVPDSDIEDQKLVDDPAWNTAFNNWVKELTSGKWGFKVVNRDPVANPEKNITAIANVAPFAVTCANHGFSTGQSVRIRLVKTLAGKINGIYTITVVDANSFTLNGYAGPLTYLSGGVVQARINDVAPITQVIKGREVSHKRGRPVFSPHGRKSPKRK